ncbi:MAG: hypothetical protein CMJ18_19045, partial [Phycisphaeraceae bacterium]|nr:hypothetical protein [Phycisphaeraceae bacterium]
MTPDGESLPLLGAALEADARGGIARVVLRQRFVNSGSEPLRLTYQVPIPADAAVSGYVFTVGDKRIVGEIDRRDAARERFEQALVEGHTAALLEQERTSIFTQEIGNVPAGTEVECALTLDQKLRWLDDGMWEWRFPTVVGPRYMGAPGRVADEKKITVDVSETPLPSTVSLMMSVRDEIAGGVAQSPSHPVVVEEESGRARIRLADGAGARLDRDVVVRWPVAEAKLGVTIDVARPESGQPTARSAYGLLTLVPPTAEQGGPTVPRDLILLIDTSGSMSGEPLDQAKLIAQDVVASMDARDRLEMVEFSSRPNRWKRRPQPMNDAARAEAEKWVQSLQAGGGTEMVDGIVEALRPLRDDAQRQVIILTDGYVGFEDEVVDAMRRDLPPNCRVHSVGVGSAPNQSLIGPVARIGRGVGMTIGLDEDAADGARRLVARTAAPIVVNASVSGDAVLDVPKHAMCDLYRGAPALIPMKLNGKGGEIVLQGETVDGAWRQTLTVPAVAAREGSAAVTTLYGREAVEELETTGVAGASLDRKIEQLGLRFQIATRMTSW